ERESSPRASPFRRGANLAQEATGGATGCSASAASSSTGSGAGTHRASSSIASGGDGSSQRARNLRAAVPAPRCASPAMGGSSPLTGFSTLSGMLEVMTLTILDGSTFCICADDGAITEGAHGFYADDTRFLSRLSLRINGEPPMPLSAGKVEYFAASFFLRNPRAGGLGADDLLIRRERFVTDDLQEHVVVTNLTGEALTVELTVELASDFADILSIKHHDFALGDPGLAEALPAPVALSAGATPQMACLLDPGGVLSTEVRSSRAALVSGSALAFALALGPHAEWDVRLTFRPVTGRARPGRTPRARHFGEQRARIQRSLSAWNLHVPQLRASWPELNQAYARSVSDLAALRMRGSDGVGLLPAAGMPWFMAV